MTKSKPVSGDTELVQKLPSTPDPPQPVGAVGLERVNMWWQRMAKLSFQTSSVPRVSLAPASEDAFSGLPMFSPCSQAANRSRCSLPVPQEADHNPIRQPHGSRNMALNPMLPPISFLDITTVPPSSLTRSSLLEMSSTTI